MADGGGLLQVSVSATTQPSAGFATGDLRGGIAGDLRHPAHHPRIGLGQLPEVCTQGIADSAGARLGRARWLPGDAGLRHSDLAAGHRLDLANHPGIGLSHRPELRPQDVGDLRPASGRRRGRSWPALARLDRAGHGAADPGGLDCTTLPAGGAKPAPACGGAIAGSGDPARIVAGEPIDAAWCRPGGRASRSRAPTTRGESPVCIAPVCPGHAALPCCLRFPET